MTATAQLTRAEDMKAFLLAGNATFTLRSLKTGVRYTFKVRRPTDVTPWFVSVMYGPDNESDFAFLGSIFSEGVYKHSRKSAMPEGDVREKAFEFFYRHIIAGQTPPQLEVWHEGRCCRCGRKLTVPESIATGLGPECASRLAEAQPELFCEVS